MLKFVKFVFGLMIAAGFLLVIGTAGADCDGKCMENSLTIGEIIQFMFYGIILIAIGAFGMLKVSEYDY